MVKFGKYLESHVIPEWSTQYVRYKRLKKVLKQIELEYAEREHQQNTSTTGGTANTQVSKLGDQSTTTTTTHPTISTNTTTTTAAPPPAPNIATTTSTTNTTSPQPLKLTKDQKEALAAIREKKKLDRKRSNGVGRGGGVGGVNGSGGGLTPNGAPPLDKSKSVDTPVDSLRMGQEWITRSRAAVLESERRLQAQNDSIVNGMKGKKLSQCYIADMTDEATDELDQTEPSTNGKPTSTPKSSPAPTAAPQPPPPAPPPPPAINDRVGNFDFTEDELNAEEPEKDDQTSLDVALSEGKKHKTDAVLVAEDRNMKKLTKYIPPEIVATFTKGEHTFFRMLEEDVITINHFFLKQEDFFLDKINIIVEQLDRLIKEEEEHQKKNQIVGININGSNPPASNADSATTMKERLKHMIHAAQHREDVGLQSEQSYRSSQAEAIELAKIADQAAALAGKGSSTSVPLQRKRSKRSISLAKASTNANPANPSPNNVSHSNSDDEKKDEEDTQQFPSSDEPTHIQRILSATTPAAIEALLTPQINPSASTATSSQALEASPSQALFSGVPVVPLTTSANLSPVPADYQQQIPPPPPQPPTIPAPSSTTTAATSSSTSSSIPLPPTQFPPTIQMPISTASPNAATSSAYIPRQRSSSVMSLAIDPTANEIEVTPDPIDVNPDEAVAEVELAARDEAEAEEERDDPDDEPNIYAGGDDDIDPGANDDDDDDEDDKEEENKKQSKKSDLSDSRHRSRTSRRSIQRTDDALLDAIERSQHELEAHDAQLQEQNQLHSPASDNSDHQQDNNGGQISATSPPAPSAAGPSDSANAGLINPDPNGSASLAQHMHLHLKFRLLTAQKPWRVLEKALTELYRGLHLLRNYKILNFTAFVKILKKYDKLNLHGDAFRTSATLLPRIQSTHFLASPILKAFIRRVELIFAETFTEGDHKLALDNLRVVRPPMKSSVIFQLGLFLGLSGIMLAVMLFLAGWAQDGLSTNSAITIHATLPVWRGLGLVILHMWGWGINVFLFHKYRINHEFIFEINPRTELKFEHLLIVAASLSTLWFLLMDIYLFLGLAKGAGVWSGTIVTGWIPFVLFVVFCFICFMPFDAFFRPTRWYILRTLYKVIMAPFYSVDFKDFYFGDQLCSLVNVFNDVAYSFCFFTTGDFVLDVNSDTRCVGVRDTAVWLLASLPYYWRLVQCGRKYYDYPAANGRQLWNMGKYTSSIITTLLSLLNKSYPNTAFFPLWLASASISTLYSYFWDVYCDWGFLRFEPGEFTPKLLRRKLVLNNHVPYYFAIISNFALRVAWVFTISPTGFGLNLRTDVFNTGIWSLEVLRRNQWNFYRLENEHLTNCEHYRVVNIVPLKMSDAPTMQQSPESAAGTNGEREQTIRRYASTGRSTSKQALAEPASITRVDHGDDSTAPLLTANTRSNRHLDNFTRFDSTMLTAPDAKNMDPDRHDDPELHELTMADAPDISPPTLTTGSEVSTEEKQAIDSLQAHLSPSPAINVPSASPPPPSTASEQPSATDIAASALPKSRPTSRRTTPIHSANRRVSRSTSRLGDQLQVPNRSYNNINEVRIHLPGDDTSSSSSQDYRMVLDDSSVPATKDQGGSHPELYGSGEDGGATAARVPTTTSEVPSSILHRSRRLSFSQHLDAISQSEEDDALRSNQFDRDTNLAETGATESTGGASASTPSTSAKASRLRSYSSSRDRDADDLFEQALARRKSITNLSMPMLTQTLAQHVAGDAAGKSTTSSPLLASSSSAVHAVQSAPRLGGGAGVAGLRSSAKQVKRLAKVAHAIAPIASATTNNSAKRGDNSDQTTTTGSTSSAPGSIAVGPTLQPRRASTSLTLPPPATPTLFAHEQDTTNLHGDAE